jgi:hypothetical protein
MNFAIHDFLSREGLTNNKTGSRRFAKLFDDSHGSCPSVDKLLRELSRLRFGTENDSEPGTISNFEGMRRAMRTLGTFSYGLLVFSNAVFHDSLNKVQFL